jgi:fermentation-respiration switch protein FrsA (DUF1100 family)
MIREDVTFPSGADTCAAWLYRPDTSDLATRAGLPIIVMAHGLGAVKEMRLDAYAERFVAAGVGVLLFDYRYFGASTGQPRQLLSVRRQHEDYLAALDHVRTLPWVDVHRIALFGSSFSGGHVLAVAARDPWVAAVVAQCPFTDGLASALALGPVSSARLAPRALADEVARLLRRPRVRIPLAGAPGTGALMTAPDVVPGYSALVPPGFVHEGTVAGQIGTRIALYSPGRAVKNLKMPVFFAICDKDTVAPAGRTARYAAGAERGEVRHYPVGHFDIYLGEPFEQTIADQIDFLRRHLAR